MTANKSSSHFSAKNAEVLKLTAPGRGGEHKEDAISREWVNTLVRPKALLRNKAKSKHGDYSKSSGRGENQAECKDDEDKDDKKKSRLNLSGDTSTYHPLGHGTASSRRALDPSVIFTTITNTGEGMTCLHISKGVTQAVAGFRDSCLRVWKLNEKDESSARRDRLLGGPWNMHEVLPNQSGSRDPSKGSSLSQTTISCSPSLFSNNREDIPGSDLRRSMSSGVLELYGHSKAVYGVSQSADDDCRLLLSCSADETIRLWDTSVSQCVGKYSCIGPSWGVSFSPLDYYFASANQVRILRYKSKISPTKIA